MPPNGGYIVMDGMERASIEIYSSYKPFSFTITKMVVGNVSLLQGGCQGANR